MNKSKTSKSPSRFLLHRNGVGAIVVIQHGGTTDAYDKVQDQFNELTRRCTDDPLDSCDMIRLFDSQCHQGIFYDEWLINCDGSGYNILAMPQHTTEDIAEVEKFLRSERDVVVLKVTRITRMIDLSQPQTTVSSVTQPAVRNDSAMHTELYCRTLTALDPIKCVRAMHQAYLQFRAIEKGVESVDNKGAIIALEEALASAGHDGFVAGEPRFSESLPPR